MVGDMVIVFKLSQNRFGAESLEVKIGHFGVVLAKIRSFWPDSAFKLLYEPILWFLAWELLPKLS